MEKETSRNFKLGLFILTGSVLLVISLYIIGSKRNLFGDSIHINALFYNVNGLVKGNNVRYSGIDIGTVEKVEIINDTSVKVVMLIDKNMQPFIKTNATAAIGTDGLMGNKIINIASMPAPAPIISEGDTLATLKPIDTDVVMRTLNTTNVNVEAITRDLRDITRKFSNSNTLWSLLLDTVVSQNVKQAIVNIKVSSKNTVELTGDLSQLVKNVKNGNGTIGSLITDTTLSNKIEQAVVSIQLTGQRTAIATGNLEKLTEKIKNGDGAVGALLMDTTLVPRLNQSIDLIKKGAGNFNENMEAMKQVPFIRNYFKNKEKKKAGVDSNQQSK